MSRPKQSKDGKVRKQRRQIQPEDLKLVRENFPYMSVKQLSKIINLSESSIKRLARKCGMMKIGAIKEVRIEQMNGIGGIFLLQLRCKNRIYLSNSVNIGNQLNYFSQLFPQFNYTNYVIYFVNKSCEDKILKAYKNGLDNTKINLYEDIKEFFN